MAAQVSGEVKSAAGPLSGPPIPGITPLPPITYSARAVDSAAWMEEPMRVSQSHLSMADSER